jgi:hypothetical protein
VLATGAKCDPTSKTDVCALSPDAGGIPSAVCVPSSSGSTNGVCKASIEIAQGSDCTTPGAICVSGTYCIPDAGGTVCTGGSPVGMPCDAKLGCQFNAYCALSKSGKVGTCKSGGGAGAACTTNAECGQAAPYCVDMKCSAKSGGC